MEQLTPGAVFKVAQTTIQAADYSFLITFNPAGYASSRLMQHFAPETDLTIWFGASRVSRKVREIQYNSQATVSFLPATEPAYATLVGTAQLETDLALRQHYWRDDWIAFFPAGAQGDDYILIKFVPTRIEVINFTQEVATDPYGLKPATLIWNGTAWDFEPGNDEFAHRQAA